MKRLDKIKQTYHDRLESYIKDNSMDIRVDNVFDTIVYNDPSHDKRYTKWLVETLLNDGFLWEDLRVNFPDEDLSTNFKGEDLRVSLHYENNESDSKVTETLRVFMKHSRKLLPVDRSINRYQSIADIWKMVKQYADDKTGHQVKREEYDRAMSESELVVDNDDIRIIVPLTEYASKFHGRGTRWCTAADNRNMFWDYAEKAPLFIITLKGSYDKLQLWKNGDNVQFMDSDDKTVSKEYIENNWNLLKDIIKYIGLLEYVPEKYKTSDLCKIAVKQNGASLSYVPYELRTYELCQVAVLSQNQTISALKYVPNKYKTPELCKIAVDQNYEALKYVPNELKTYELCKLACEKDGRSIHSTPDKLKTYELCELACKKDNVGFAYIPENMLTYELCKIAVQQNGWVLRHIPNKFKTPELCQLAIKENGRLLEYVPNKLKTYEFCKLACEKDGEALEYVPYMKYSIFRYIFAYYKTYELCKIACSNGMTTLLHIPERFITPELCEIACKTYGNALKFVPDKYKTSELCEIAVKQNGRALEHVPEHLITPELCEIAYKQKLKIIPTNTYEQEINKLKEIVSC